MNDEMERKLTGLLSVGRSEAFWIGQKRRILGRTALPARARSAWLLVPAAAAAALLIFLSVPRRPATGPEPRQVSAAFLEHLDMLDDMDVLEAVPESEL